jgi:hypothetical protein
VVVTCESLGVDCSGLTTEPVVGEAMTGGVNVLEYIEAEEERLPTSCTVLDNDIVEDVERCVVVFWNDLL